MRGSVVDWWVWVLIALLVVIVLVGGFALVQARRRAGGVIASRGSKDTPGSRKVSDG